MARARIQLEHQRDFTGGLNVADDAYNLAPNESFDLMDVDIDRRGGFGQRRGRRIVSARLAGPFHARSLAQYTTSSGGQQIIYHKAGDHLYYYDVGADTSAGIRSGLGNEVTYLARTAIMSGKAYIVGDDTNSFGWDGTTRTDLGTSYVDDITAPTGGNMPLAKTIAVHNHVMWVGNLISEGGCRVRWSHPGRPEDWRTNDWIELDNNSGTGHVTALIPYGERLIVFKERAIYAIHGYAPNGFSVQTLTQEIGAPSQEAVVATEDGIFFWDQTRGAFAWDGEQFHWIFRKLHHYVRGGHVNMGESKDVTVEWHNERAWFSVPFTNTDDDYWMSSRLGLIFHPMAGGGEGGGAWTVHSRAPERWLSYRDSTGQGFLWGHTSDYDEQVYGHIIEYDVENKSTDEYQLNSSTFEERIARGWYTTRWFDAGNPALDKRWKRPVVVAKAEANQEIVVDVLRDYDPSRVRKTFKLTTSITGDEMVWDVDNWDEANWAAQTGLTERSTAHKGSTLGNGKAIALRFSSPASSADWAVHGVTVKWIAKRIRS